MRLVSSTLLLLLAISGTVVGEDDAGPWLRALADEAHAGHAAALADWDATEPKARIALLRDVLAGEDDALAEIAAWALGAEHLSLAEIHRQMDLRVRDPARALPRKDRYAWAECGWMPTGGVDLIRLARHAVRDAELGDVSEVFEELHRAVDPSMLPALVPLLEKGNANALRGLLHLFRMAADYDFEDVHRDLVTRGAAYVLSRLDAERRGATRPRLEGSAPREPTEGFPDEFALLAAAEWFDQPGAEAVPLHWLRRWTRDLEPVETDASLLITLTQEPDSYVPLVAMRKLAALSSERARTFLQATAAVRSPEGARAAAALFERGQPEPFDALRAQTASAELVRAEWVVDPRGARERWVREFLAPEEVPLDLSPEDRVQLASFYGVRVRTEDLDWITKRILDPSTPGAVVARFVTEIRPEAMSADVAKRIVEAIWDWPATLDDDRPFYLDLDSLLGRIEVHAPKALRSLLHHWAEEYGEGLEYLARLGDTRFARKILAAWEEEGWLPAEIVGRVKDGSVRRRLEELADSGNEEIARAALGALAVYHGLPLRLAQYVVLEDDTARRLVLEGDPVAAVVHEAETGEPGPVFYLGLVDDDRVRAVLRRYREERHQGLYWTATAGLALGGDAAARAEFVALLRENRTWMLDALWDPELSLAGDPALAELWLERLDANCCLGFYATVGLEGIYPAWPFDHGFAVAREAAARAYLEGTTPVRSRILDGWVPVRP